VVLKKSVSSGCELRRLLRAATVQPPPGRELVTDPTLSYIDAGSGSLLLQAIAGGVAAAGVMAKVYWKRLRRFLHIEKPEDESSTTG
jgi:hypothetical protein